MSRPALSVVLAMPGGYDRVRRTVDHLRAQTVCDRIEIVLVTDRDGADVPAAAVEGFAAMRIVHVGELRSRAAANAAGFADARADVVVFAEDHCFPDASWAEALLHRHAEPWAAVGPAVHNANPDSVVSWCDLLLNYGPWLSPHSGPASALPGHNTSYKRAALARYGDGLEGWLEVEAELHADLDAGGCGLFYDAAARVAHVNISRALPWLACTYLGGRIYAAARSRSWGVARKAGYAVASPAIALVRFARLHPQWPSPPSAPARPRVVATLLAGLCADAVGQAVGYVAGAGRASCQMARFEFERVAHVRAPDRALLGGAS